MIDTPDNLDAARRQHKLDRELVDSIIDVESGLTDWEAGFVDSLLHSLKRSDTSTLTPKQRGVAQNIQRNLDAQGDEKWVPTPM